MKENLFWIILFGWWMATTVDWDVNIKTDNIKLEAQSPTKSQKESNDGPVSDF